MAGRFTFAMVKPDAVAAGNAGKILSHTEAAGFTIRGLRMITLGVPEAKAFYEVHSERPFYGELVEFMSSGPAIVMVLESENAVVAWREAIGATNPDQADEGTIRKLYAESMGKNAVHGSDSDDNAMREIGFFFSEGELATLGTRLTP